MLTFLFCQVNSLNTEKRRKFPTSSQSNASYKYSQKRAKGSSYGTGSAYYGDGEVEEYCAPAAQKTIQRGLIKASSQQQ
jgi:hypothetical protein